MDNRAFRKHLRDFVHGKHHPEEHDWTGDSMRTTAKSARETRARSAKAGRKSKKR